MARRGLVALRLLLGVPLVIAASGACRASERGKEDDAKEAKGVIIPELDRCTLSAEGSTFKPVGTSSQKLTHAVRNLRIQLEGTTVSAFKAGSENPQWTAKAPGDVELAWLAADEKVIYLSGYRIQRKPERFRPEAPVRVHRLEIASGKWLEDLAVDGSHGPKETESIGGVLARDGRVVVLIVRTDEDTGRIVCYRVSCFKAGETRSLWSETFLSAGRLWRTGSVLLCASREPASVEPDIQPLTWLGDDVLVCAGPVQDLVCLEGGTGKQRWRVERVWEYERDFIGPSVWQHVLVRSGGAGQEKKHETWPPARQQFIIGGPVIVDRPKGRPGNQDRSIFVVVGKGPTAYAEYLVDCVVYELDSDGQPLAMANLPRGIRGEKYRIQEDGVVWACQGEAFVKVGVSRNRSTAIGMGPGGPDLLCRIDWYRHISAEEPDAWLTAAPAGEPVAFGDAFAFRVCAGGYVMSPNAGAYNFPLSMIDLKTGVDRALVLRVPYKGTLPEPKTSRSRWLSPRGKDCWRTLEPYVLAITRLQVEGDRLRVTLGMEGWARSLEFAIDELQSRKQK